MSSIILIRHGECLANADSRYFDVPDHANILTPKGVDQALALHKTLPSIMNEDRFGTHTTIIASKHKRTQLTAEIATFGMGYPIVVDSRVNECWHQPSEHDPEDYVNTESREFVVDRVKRVVDAHEFDLIIFCHGVLMDVLDPRGYRVENCEVRKYDRKDFIERILK
jgi:broad specificity phosphatase PhoE